MMNYKLGLLLSGDLGFQVLSYLNKLYKLDFVFSNKDSNKVIDFCNIHSIDCFVGNPRDGACSSFIAKREIDILISVNYLYIIQKDLIDLPKKLAFNLHGSLLPKYRGRTPHVWAIINNETEAGISAHLIDEGCDTGDIIRQVIIPIKDNDTGFDILQKYSDSYIPLLKNVLNDINSWIIKIEKAK